MNPSSTFNFGPMAMILSETRFELLKAWRMPAFIIPTLTFPVAFYVLFGVILNMGGDFPMATYLVASYGVFGIIGPALFGFGVGVSQEQAQGWLRLKAASPMPGWVYFAAKGIMSMVFALLVITMLLVAGVTAGGVELSLAKWLGLFCLLALGTLPFCAMGLMIGLIVRAQAAVAIVNLIYLPMAVLSGLWFPLQLFPEVLQRIAWVLPPYHLAQLALNLIGMGQGHPAILHAGALLVFTAIFVVGALWAWQRRQID